MTDPLDVSVVPEAVQDQPGSGKGAKWNRRLKRTVVAVVAVVIGLLAISTVVNQGLNAIGLARLEVPGALAEAEGEAGIHVYSRAEHAGEPTLVFLTGAGLGSAYYELKSVWEPLAEDFNIATVDYLGYGFSDTTREERSNQNVVSEIYAALHGAGVEGPYVIVAHSLGGLYAMKFAALHPDEVAAFVGLDNTVPGQQPPEDYEGDLTSEDGGLHPTYTVLRFMGLVRLERWINGDDSILLPANPLLDEAEQDHDWLLDNTKLDLRLLDNESSWFLRNDRDLAGQRFAAAIPTLMILAQGTIDSLREIGYPDWVQVHQAVASEHPQSRIVTMDGEHMIYLDDPDQVVSQIREFLAETN